MKILAWSCFVLLSAVGCGGGGITVQCDKTFDACGGNIVGHWKFAALCDNAVSTVCTGAKLSVAGGPTITFNADSTFSNSLDSSARASIEYPASCFMGDAGFSNLTCAQLTSGSQTCTVEANQACVCMSSPMSFMPEGGTYTLTPTTVVLTVNEADLGTSGSVPVSYCVSGNILTISIPIGATSQLIEAFTRQ